MPRKLIKSMLLNESPLTRTAVRLLSGPGPIAMLLLVRNEADIVEQTLNYHLGNGIEHFVLTDNGSDDGTRDILGDFQKRVGRSVIIIDDPDPAYHQAAWVDRMIRVSKEKQRPKWIIPSDADEFWHPVSGSYFDDLDRAHNVVNCFWHNFLPRAATPWQQFTDIGDMPGYNGEMSKVFCLATGLFGVYKGNHDSRSVPRCATNSANIKIYHYPIRSYQQFERKVVQGHVASQKAGGSSSSAWHWREYYEAWEKGDLPRMYEEMAGRNRLREDRTMADRFDRN